MFFVPHEDESVEIKFVKRTTKYKILSYLDTEKS